jgi:hypothetical protein
MATRTVVCIADACSQADAIVEHLQTTGYLPADVSLLLADRESLCLSPATSRVDRPGGDSLSTTLAWLGIVDAFEVPGVGAFLGGGPVMAPLRDRELAAHPGIAHALMEVGVSAQESIRYEGRIRHGAILIALQTEDFAAEQRACSIFEDCGAEAIAVFASPPDATQPVFAWSRAARPALPRDYDWSSPFAEWSAAHAP